MNDKDDLENADHPWRSRDNDGERERERERETIKTVRMNVGGLN